MEVPFLCVMGVLGDKAKEVLEITGDDWYFIDYAQMNIPYGKMGDIIIHESMDQFKRKFDVIPQGWQVVARITGIDNKTLPIKNAWVYNENSLKIPLDSSAYENVCVPPNEIKGN